MHILKMVLATIAGTFCTIACIPQLVKIFKTKDTRSVSLMTFAFSAAGSLLWLVYGIMIGEVPFVVANAIVLLITFSIVVMKIKYG